MVPVVAGGGTTGSPPVVGETAPPPLAGSTCSPSGRLGSGGFGSLEVDRRVEVVVDRRPDLGFRSAFSTEMLTSGPAASVTPPSGVAVSTGSSGSPRTMF